MAAAAGIFNSQTSAAQALAGGVLKPMDSSTTGTSSSSSASSDSATISANDFLTLLVTEMQNQDPTATTDPNEYINQLVQVNSLEQLIGINQTLTGALGSSPTASTDSATGQNASANSLLTDAGSTGSAKPAQRAAPATVAANHAAIHASTFAAVSGNLGVPAANPAAARVASALDGRRGASPIAAGISGVR